MIELKYFIMHSTTCYILHEYIFTLEDIVQGHLDWCLKSKRYKINELILEKLTDRNLIQNCINTFCEEVEIYKKNHLNHFQKVS